MSAAQQLISVCNKHLAEDECKIRAIRGIKNLSRSDLETAILYAQTIASSGSYEGQLMKPRGGVADLLKAFELMEGQ